MKFVFILTMIYFCSCSNLKPIGYHELLPLEPATQTVNLKSRFSVTPLSSRGTYLDQVFYMKPYFDYKNPPDSLDFIYIEMLVDKKVKVDVFDNGRLVKSKVLKGKWDLNYFALRSQFSIPLFTLIFNVYNNKSTRLGLLKNGNLVVDSEDGGCGLFVLFPLFCGEGEHYGVEYEQVD